MVTVGCDVGCDDVLSKRKKRYTVEGTRAAHSATCIKYKYQTSNVQRATLTLIKQFRLFFINLRELLDYLPSSPSLPCFWSIFVRFRVVGAGAICFVHLLFLRNVIFVVVCLRLLIWFNGGRDIFKVWRFDRFHQLKHLLTDFNCSFLIHG